MLKNAIGIFIVAVVLLAAFLPSYTKMQDLKLKNAQYAARIDALQKRNLELEQERRMLENNPEYVEKVARQKMGLIRDGEKVYRVVPEQANAVRPVDK